MKKMMNELLLARSRIEENCCIVEPNEGELVGQSTWDGCHELLGNGLQGWSYLSTELFRVSKVTAQWFWPVPLGCWQEGRPSCDWVVGKRLSNPPMASGVHFSMMRHFITICFLLSGSNSPHRFQFIQCPGHKQ